MIWFQNPRSTYHNPDFALQQSVGAPGTRLNSSIGRFLPDAAGWSRRSGKKRLPRFLTTVEYYPQLNHSANPFVESPAEHNFVRQGDSHVRVWRPIFRRGTDGQTYQPDRSRNP